VVTGITSSTSNIATCGAVQLNYAGDNDIFLGKFAENVVTRGPSITITPATTGAVCPNSLVTFNATADNGGTAPSYQWLLNGSDVGNNSPSYTANNLVNGDQVSCILTSNSACILAKSATSNIIAVTVVTPSQPQINITASTDTICLGTAVSFIANAITNSQTPLYQWMVNGANVGVNSALFSSGTLNNGDIVSCTVTDNVCNLSNSSSSNKVLMTVNTNILVPSVNITVSSEPVCAGILVTFNATPLNAGNSPRYQWTLNGAVAGVNSAIFQTGSLKEGDTIACMLIPGINGCWSIPEAISNTIKMTIYPAPVIQFSTIDTAILAGASVQLNPAITGNISNYQWTPATGLSDPNIQDPSASPATTTTYQLTVTTDNVCQASAKITLKVVRTLHMPNAFTPDDNGKNTIFRIPANTSLTLKEFSVYDRWGARIFTSTDPNIGWDGTFKGVRCESGVYVYSITGSDSKGPISAKGTVILIR
jgi:gliding motility-associated-like protein